MDLDNLTTWHQSEHIYRPSEFSKVLLNTLKSISFYASSLAAFANTTLKRGTKIKEYYKTNLLKTIRKNNKEVYNYHKEEKSKNKVEKRKKYFTGFQSYLITALSNKNVYSK